MRTKKSSDPESGDRTSGVSSASVSDSSIGSARSSGTGVFSELDEHLSSLEEPVLLGVLVLHCSHCFLGIHITSLVGQTIDLIAISLYYLLTIIILLLKKQFINLLSQIYLRALCPVTTTTITTPPPPR